MMYTNCYRFYIWTNEKCVVECGVYSALLSRVFVCVFPCDLFSNGLFIFVFVLFSSPFKYRNKISKFVFENIKKMNSAFNWHSPKTNRTGFARHNFCFVSCVSSLLVHSFANVLVWVFVDSSSSIANLCVCLCACELASNLNAV